MKRKWLVLAALAALVPAAVAFAGDDFGCDNMCPLAKQANAMRSYGTEATAHAATPAAIVERNLARI